MASASHDAKSERLNVALVLDRPVKAANEEKLARVALRLRDAGTRHLCIVCEGTARPESWQLDLVLMRRAEMAPAGTAQHFGSDGFGLTLLPEGSGRAVVAAAARLLAQAGGGVISIEGFDAKIAEIAGPSPDLIIVTGSTPNLRGSFTWQAAYGEFVFVGGSWTELADADLDQALDEFAARGRRFGGIA